MTDHKPNLAVKILGWISILFLLMGTLFKLQHWPGANVGMMFGSFTFLFFYLPLWLAAGWEHSKKPRLIVGFLALFLACLAFIFKSMHWPFGQIIYLLWVYFSCFILLPYAFYLLVVHGRSSIKQFHNIIVYCFLAVLVLGSIRGSISSTDQMASSFSRSESQIKQSLNRLNIKTGQLYSIVEGDSFRLRNPELYQKIRALQQTSSETYEYVRSLRNHVIAETEKVNESTADSMSITDLRTRADIHKPTEIICGPGLNPRKGKYSGMELKDKLNSYRDTVLDLIGSQNKTFISSGINLDTEPVQDEEGETVDWVTATFSHMPLASVIVTLDNQMFEIKNAEAQVLTELVNEAAKNTGNNVAERIADISLQYAEQKREEALSTLKDQQELTQFRLNSKNEELEEQKQTMVWFVVGLLSSIIMIFFIIRSNLLRMKINKQLALQKQEIEFKNKEITDSINYAKRIQQAILPPVEQVYNALKDSFVLYKPKDVVSGDFYFFIEKGDEVIIAAADCTGHGVPGAFMSMIGSEQLTKIVVEKNIARPSDILDHLHKGIRNALKQDQSTGETRDGMDIALCKIDLKTNSLEYAGANRPLWIMRGEELLETKADKQPIGGLELDHRKSFTNQQMQLQKEDRIYIFTDGYADQFGGDKGKKFMLKNFSKLLSGLSDKSMQQQMSIIDSEIEKWKGGHEQVDDILVIGIKV
jgi:serine phosphatase RsbU (regulator of sigma subunit)